MRPDCMRHLGLQLVYEETCSICCHILHLGYDSSHGWSCNGMPINSKVSACCLFWFHISDDCGRRLDLNLLFPPQDVHCGNLRLQERLAFTKVPRGKEPSQSFMIVHCSCEQLVCSLAARLGKATKCCACCRNHLQQNNQN